MRAILIDPATRTIEEVEHDGDWQQIGRLISYRGEQETFTIVELDGNAVLYLDDNGLCKDELSTFHWGLYAPVLAGKGLILDTNVDGDTVGTTYPLELVRNQVTWSNKLTTGEVGPPQATRIIPGFGFVIVGGQGVLKDGL